MQSIVWKDSSPTMTYYAYVSSGTLNPTHSLTHSLQTINCTGADNQTTTERKCTKQIITNPNTKLALVKENHKNLYLKQFTCKNCSYQCAYTEWAIMIVHIIVLTIQHRTVRISLKLTARVIYILWNTAVLTIRELLFFLFNKLSKAPAEESHKNCYSDGDRGDARKFHCGL